VKLARLRFREYGKLIALRLVKIANGGPILRTRFEAMWDQPREILLKQKATLETGLKAAI